MAILNVNSPILLCEGYAYDWTDVPESLHKYKVFSPMIVAKLPWQARRILDRMEEYLEQDYKNTLLDFKVRTLNAGECGCPLEGWHIDVTRNPNHNSKPDRHIIYSTIVGTEFMTDRIETDAQDFANVDIPHDVKIWRSPADSIVMYDRFNLHRGPIVEKPCKRVLIRLTQTDII